MTEVTIGREGRWRSLLAILVSVFMAGFPIGLTWPLLSLILEHEGVEPTLIGLNAASSSLAVLAVGPFIPRIVSRCGVLGSIYGAIAITCTALLLLPLWTGLGPWFLLRFMLGIGLGVHWVVSETWINVIATPGNRGRLVAIYVAVFSASFACGPALIGVTGIEGWAPFLVGAGLLLLCIVPLLFAHGHAPEMPRPAAATFRNAFSQAPVIMLAALVFGFTDTALIALLPVYGLHNAMAQDAAVLMLTVWLVGNMALQLPIGWLADRFGPRRMLATCAAGAAIGPALLPFVIDSGALLWPILFLSGGAAMGIYTLALVALGARFPLAALAGANAALVAVFECGGVAGPFIGGAAMDLWDPHGFVAVLVILPVALLALLWHGEARR